MSKKLCKDEYKCAACHEIFLKDWTDEEAKKEAQEIWGDDIGDDPVIVCDDCFRAMTKALPPIEALEQKQSIRD